MTTITEVGHGMQTLLTSYADELGRSSGFIQRARKLSGSAYAQGLVFGWLANPAATMSELAQATATAGVVMSKQGLDQRFSEASARFLGALLQQGVSQMIAGTPMQAGVLGVFSEVHVVDSTSISLPDSLRDVWAGCNRQGVGSAALKVSVDWELIQGQLVGVQLSAAKQHDQHSPLAHTALPTRALRLADLGYFNLTTFAEYARSGSYFLSRLKVNCNLYTPDGQAFDWAAHLLACADDCVTVDVLVGSEQLVCRLLAWRVPPEVADWRRHHLQQAAADKGRPVSPRRFQTAAWSVYITNVPATDLPLASAQVLAKVRWQIELLFKLWKSDGLLDEWRSENPWRVLTECYAKLLALLIQHWCILLGAWHLPNRSLHQASQLVRKHAFYLAAVLRDWVALCTALATLARGLQTCRMSTLKQAPHTFQAIQRGYLA